MLTNGFEVTGLQETNTWGEKAWVCGYNHCGNYGVCMDP